MIYKIVEDLKVLGINIDSVNQVSFGTIEEYKSKEVKYPYINISIGKYDVYDWTKRYTLNIHILDRNKDQYIAYNKTSTIMQEFLSNPDLEIDTYKMNYFNLQFPDQIYGVTSTIQLYGEVNLECGLFVDTHYIITEQGDYIRLENNEGRIIQE